jgi:hypothetical protein
MGTHQSVYFLEYEMDDREIEVWEISAYRPTDNEEGCGTWNEINQTESEAD